MRSLVELYTSTPWTQSRPSAPPTSGQESHWQESRDSLPTYSCGTSVLTNVVDSQFPDGAGQSPDEDADAEEEPAEEPEEVPEYLIEVPAGPGQSSSDRGPSGALALTNRLDGLRDLVRRHKPRKAPQWNGPLQEEPPSGAWFPTDIETAFAASVRLPHGTSLLVDTGSPGNITGSEWTRDHARELAAVSLPPPRYTERERPMVCSGVGTGSQSATMDVEVPIALGSDRMDGYRAPELPDSRTPALLGRIAMRKKRVLLDTFTGKFFMIGPGGYELKLSPGSEVYDTEDSQAGHMMLPCSQFNCASRKQRKDEAQIFVVGNYFPQESMDGESVPSRAALQRLPNDSAETNQTFSERLNVLETDLLTEIDRL